MSSFRQALTIKRQSASTLVNGVYVNGAITTLTIQASIQPLSGEDVKMLPEGARVGDKVKVYTDTNLQVLGEALRIEPDVIVWRGHDYKCISVDVRQMGVIPHYKYIFSRVTQ